jgi:hypothetical protein
MDDLFRVLGLVVVAMIIIFIIIRAMKFNLSVMEGLTNNTSGTAPSDAESNAAKIKALTTTLTDSLLISKYRKDYETLLINADDYCGALMLQKIQSCGSNDTEFIKCMADVNTLKEAKDSLNVTMKWLDGK